MALRKASARYQGPLSMASALRAVGDHLGALREIYRGGGMGAQGAVSEAGAESTRAAGHVLQEGRNLLLLCSPAKGPREQNTLGSVPCTLRSLFDL